MVKNATSLHASQTHIQAQKRTNKLRWQFIKDISGGGFCRRSIKNILRTRGYVRTFVIKGVRQMRTSAPFLQHSRVFEN